MGSPVIASRSARTLGAFSAGANVSSRMCREQHEAEANGHAAKVAGACSAAKLECQQTDQEQNRRDS